MRDSVKVFGVLTALVVAAGIALLLSRFEKERIMDSNSTPVPGRVTVQLPGPILVSATSLEEALAKRRSIREYRKGPLSLEEIGRLLWAAQGINRPGGFRTAPSAGALYPLETYLVAGEVDGLDAGVYRYLPDRHSLALVRFGDARGRLRDASLHQHAVADAPASIVIGAAFARTTGKYGRRGIRYCHMEAGAVAQNIALQAVSLRLGTVVIGAFEDDEARSVLSMPAPEDPLIIMPVGREPDAP